MQTYTETVIQRIKSFKRGIVGTSIKATTVRASHGGAYVKFSDETCCNIRIQDHGILTVEPYFGGPKKTVEVRESIHEIDPERASDLLERKLSEWLASSEQDVFHAVQCHNEWALLEKIDHRIKSLGIKSTQLVNETLLANMFKHGLIKKDSANCWILPEMSKDRFCQLLKHAGEEVLASLLSLTGIGWDTEVEAGGRKYPVKILGHEVISAKDLPKSRRGEIISLIQRAIDSKNDEKCSKCGGKIGSVTWSPFDNDRREFRCDSCDTKTEMTRRFKLVTKFSDSSLSEKKPLEKSLITTKHELDLRIDKCIAESGVKEPEGYKAFFEDLLCDVYIKLREVGLVVEKGVGNVITISNELDDQLLTDTVERVTVTLTGEYNFKNRKKDIMPESVVIKYLDSITYESRQVA